jgi:hypothetical protein
MKEIKLVIDPDGTFRLYAEGAEGAAAAALKAELEKTGKIIERHVGHHPHGTGHHHHGDDHEHVHG